jgi:hypothetical protein
LIAKGTGTPPEEENICQKEGHVEKEKGSQFPVFYSGFPTRVHNPFKCLI